LLWIVVDGENTHVKPLFSPGNVYIIMPRINAPKCPHPKCGSIMTRCYLREGGSSQLVWWCRECGETIVGN